MIRAAVMPDPLDAVRAACEVEVAALRGEGLPAIGLGGRLIRPLLGYAGAGGRVDAPLGRALLAVQYAHEASLLHDDVVDGATERRGAPTRFAKSGVAAALVEGDHLLATGYRLAARTGSLAFAEKYARAVERTIAGERLQQKLRGRVLEMSEYVRVVLGKSGELVGCAFAAAAVLRGDVRAGAMFEAGRRIGLWYQMVDDLVDYCPESGSGKSSLGDYRQRLWTWPLAFVPDRTWPPDEDALWRVLTRPDVHGRPPLAAALIALRTSAERRKAEVAELLPGDTIVAGLLDDWLARAQKAVATVLSRHEPPTSRAPSTASTPVLPDAASLEEFFGRNSLSFSFAAKLLPRGEHARIADVYAFCRVTDDIVDSAAGRPAAIGATLDAWEAVCTRAYDAGDTGHATLDRVLREAAARGVPFDYVRELIAGMRMDLEPVRYASLQDLRTYTYRVASVVGLWLTRLWGVSDSDVLARAADLGHAMQLTNILRDVGEDLRGGRVYLPEALLRRHGVDEATLRAIAAGGTPPASYRALVEELMAVADAHYARAFEAMPALPLRPRLAVAVAAEVYRGIHGRIRANGYDNVNVRARTSLARKVGLAVRGLARLARVSIRPHRRMRAAAVTGAVVVLLLMSCGGDLMAQESTRAHLARVEARLAASPGDSLIRIERLRALYFVAVEDEGALDSALAEVAAIRERHPVLAATEAALLGAYDGALDLLRAKHGFWPHARWRDARRGLERLDAAVARAPRHPEVRYLRLVSCYYLPSLFGRSDSVREDFVELADLLPEVGPEYPRPFVHDVARFVLAHAELEPLARRRLEAWLAEDG